jgi:undecaprenyl-diphosphatase
MRWLAIVNPAAGHRGEAERALDRFRRGLREGAGTIEIAGSAASGDCARIAADARAFDGLLVFGGDGTVSEVINAMEAGRQRLAVVPCGHGNCLARELGLSGVDDALAVFWTGHARRIDLLRARFTRDRDRPSDLLVASTMAAGYVCDTVALGRSRFAGLGRLAYAAASVLTRPRRIALSIDGREGVSPLPMATGIVINNTRYLANFQAFPDASLDDGLLDVMEQGHGWGRQMLHNLSVLAGSRRFGPCRLRQARSVSVRFARGETLMVDGELVPRVTGVDAVCEPSAVAVLCRPRRGP